MRFAVILGAPSIGSETVGIAYVAGVMVFFLVPCNPRFRFVLVRYRFREREELAAPVLINAFYCQI